MYNKLLLALLLTILACWVSNIAHADDQLVAKAKSLNARDFDKTLPAQPIEEWLLAHIPASYKIVWGEYITDCGESTGTEVDMERNMPLCAEVEIKEGAKLVGYLALFVATQKKGLLEDGKALYFGYLEHNGMKYNFRRLSEVMEIK